MNKSGCPVGIAPLNKSYYCISDCVFKDFHILITKLVDSFEINGN